jgi:hypothetical protein
MIQEYGKFTDGATYDPKKGVPGLFPEVATLEAIRITQLQACPKNYKKKIVPILFEQTTYTAMNLYLKSNQLGHVLYHCYYLYMFRNVIPFELFSKSKQTVRIPQK